MAGRISDYFSHQAYSIPIGLLPVFITSAFLESSFGEPGLTKYVIMLVTGGASAAWLIVGTFLNRSGDAPRRTAKALLWGGGAGVAIEAILHLPISFPEPLLTFSQSHAKTAADYAVGVSASLATLALGFTLRRPGPE